MGLVTILQTESASNVLLEQGLLGNLSNEGSIDGLLVSNTLSLDLLLDSLVTKELLLSGSLLGSLLAGEVGNVELLDLDGLNVDTGGGGNDVTSVNSSKRNTVDLEGTRDKESRVLKSLEEDNSLTTETTSKNDQDGTGDKRSTELLRSGGLTGLLESRSRLGGVPLLGLLGGNGSVGTVLSLKVIVSKKCSRITISWKPTTRTTTSLDKQDKTPIK